MQVPRKWYVAILCATAIGWLVPRTIMAVDNSDCLACHSDKELTRKGADGKPISLFVDEAKYATSVHGKLICTSCHTDTTQTPHPDNFKAKSVTCAQCHEKQIETYGASVHGVAQKNGDGKAAGCADCHGVHDITKHTSPQSPLNRANLLATCGACHTKASADMKKSVHGKMLAKGVAEAPTCTDCHSEHKIEKLASATPMKISEDVCSRCHASERLNTKFSLPTDRVSTFYSSYHGLAARMGSPTAANCASCHGWHDVLPSSDPESRINPAHLAATCGECHPGIGTRLARETIRIHAPPGEAAGKHWIVNFVSRFYVIVIVVTIGAMLAHNALDYIVKARAHIQKARAESGEERLSWWARVQHFSLVVLFVLLAYTGFVHKFPEAIWSWPFQAMSNGNYARGMIHRIAGWAFTALLVGHCLALVSTKSGRVELRALWLRVKDLKDVWATLLFNLGLRKTPPAREKFNYVEKTEYWALMWGSIVMILTGLMLIFTEAVLRFLPKVWLDVAQVVHYYEAVLATLAILVWHFYAVLFDPHEYPMNPAWLTGKRPYSANQKAEGKSHAAA